jgi:hypothetical protein
MPDVIGPGTPGSPGVPPIANEDRRRNLRRLDDILEALEQMNLRDETELSEPLERRLVELGIEQPRALSISELIERVWALQQPFLIQVTIDRRRRRRRQSTIDLRQQPEATR